TPTFPAISSQHLSLPLPRRSFCLGVCEAGRTSSLANRKDNYTGRGQATPIWGPGRGLKRIKRSAGFSCIAPPAAGRWFRSSTRADHSGGVICWKSYKDTQDGERDKGAP